MQKINKKKKSFLFDLLEFDSGHNPKGDLCLQRGYFLSQNGQLGS